MNQEAGGKNKKKRIKIRKTKRKVCKLLAKPERMSYIRKEALLKKTDVD